MQMRVLFALSGLHRIDRGAERAFISVADELVRMGDSVTLIGSGPQRGGTLYQFIRSRSVKREYFERFPNVPLFRDECGYEELTFVPELIWNYNPRHYDITLTCSYPFTNWILRRPELRGSRPPHIFVTQNGDWPAFASRSTSNASEYRFFSCDGLVCINPEFFDRNKDYWNCRLIPNGVDCERFHPGEGGRTEFGIPQNRYIVLMVSALIASKRVETGIDAVSRIPDAHLVVAGDGPLRSQIAKAASAQLPGRFTLLTAPPERMPLLYRSADAFLHCSREEAFGNVFVEAMSCGLPIVAHDSPRLRWIVGERECLVDTSDPAIVTDGLLRARNLGATGKSERIERAHEFSWSNITKKYRDFFSDVLRKCDSGKSGQTKW